ncbi:MAG: SAM-dependent methyltransferase [Chloroflexi bacterium]|nr:MAG: SAM-dependent methyltransferase [Chloroflexota bacterium]
MLDKSSEQLLNTLSSTLERRSDLYETNHRSAFRLYNGFYEGNAYLAVDLYARTLMIHDYSDSPVSNDQKIAGVHTFYQEKLPWLNCTVLKQHKAEAGEMRRGQIISGGPPDRKVQENGVWYALDLLLHQDTSLYLDTRNLRLWLKENCSGMRILNTFAYTGSLGAAALAGGANKVVQLDLNRSYHNLAKTTYTLNGFPIDKSDFITGDFFPVTSRLRRERILFDCVILDPPFFSTTARGAVDLLEDTTRLINKVRPLVDDGGYLIVINNALYLAGRVYMKELETLEEDGYLELERLISVPPDFSGYPETIANPPLVDPYPFNHSTKITVLRVKRK